eukprot:12949975-Heterocapsa_arctica.AAC.1
MHAARQQGRVEEPKPFKIQRSGPDLLILKGFRLESQPASQPALASMQPASQPASQLASQPA